MTTLNDFAALEDVFFPEKAQARKEQERLAHEKAVAECKALIRACDETIEQISPESERLYKEYSAIRDKWWDAKIGTGASYHLEHEKDKAYKAYRDIEQAIESSRAQKEQALRRLRSLTAK